MSQCVIIGVTGGVGAGKSTILAYLKEKYQAVILEADAIGRVLMMPGGETYRQILDTYGEDLKRKDGMIDTQRLAKRLFEETGDTAGINAIVHPAVVNYMKRRIEQERLEAYLNRENSLHLVILEAAILFEGGAAPLCDDIWYVWASEEERTRRLMESRGYSEEKVRAIMKQQMSEAEFREKCDFTLPNEGDWDKTRRMIDEHIQELQRREWP